MIITQFQEEMPFSMRIRAEREGLFEPAVDKYLVKIEELEPPNLSYALPKLNGRQFKYPDEVQEAAVLKVLEDGTAWPLIGLVNNFSVSSLMTKSFDNGFYGKAHGHGCPRFRRIVRGESHLRFCHECACHQRARYGVSWWWRSLNLPLVAVCPIHKIALSYIDARRMEEKYGYLPHEVLETCDQMSDRVSDEDINIAQVLIHLCRSAVRCNTASLKARVDHAWYQSRNQPLPKTCTLTHRLMWGSGKHNPIGCSLHYSDKDDCFLMMIATSIQLSIRVEDL